MGSEQGKQRFKDVAGMTEMPRDQAPGMNWGLVPVSPEITAPINDDTRDKSNDLSRVSAAVALAK
jgi:hypothetical protein